METLVGAEERESRIVNIAQGPVRGYKDPESGLYFFQSIPYATVPTGPNRYKVPLPPPTWKEPLEAISSGITCPQIILPYATLFPDQNAMQEDCLIASVYVPDTKEKKLPVAVFVHGGAYQIGSGDWFMQTKLAADNNIITVTFNYRLGAHGFLCLGTKDIPGNAGMKDQVAALRWVKKNIASFGGNPDDVTIQGGSAGSSSVDLLMLSELAEGLFNKVIPESGANIAAWVIQSDPIENAKNIAKYLNFTNVDDINALEEFYKTVSFELLNSVPFFDYTDATFGLSPCVERATGGEVFLDKPPVDILKSGRYKKLPLLYGFSEMEGLIRKDFFYSWKHKMNEKFSDFLPGDLTFESEKQREQVAKGIKKFYFGDNPVENDNVLDFVDFVSDVVFIYPMLRAVKYHIEAGHHQIYLYKYSFVDSASVVVPHTNITGAHHCAQTLAVMGTEPGFDESKITEEFLHMSSTMRKIWGSFIKTGRPAGQELGLPSWPAVNSKNRSPYMSLSNEISLQNEPLLERRAQFWDNIYEKYYRDPLTPLKTSLPKTEL